jgi:hypothetical protein
LRHLNPCRHINTGLAFDIINHLRKRHGRQRIIVLDALAQGNIYPKTSQ